MVRYIFVAGGVMSGIGKGIATASIGRILKSKGFKATTIKIDPYINVDAGTMDPIEHGEIFVTDDGTQCDQDLGHYERFLDEDLTTDNSITTGQIYETVIQKERNLEYGGRCVEAVPDIPNEVIFRIKKVAKITGADFVLIEIGGTIGEYQNLLFLEAARMMKLKEPQNVISILISYLPIPEMIGEMKTKPTQTAVRLLNEAGIQPDIILGRAPLPLDELRKRKISIFCNVAPEDVISAPDTGEGSVYEVPINFEKENLGNKILKKFGLRVRKRNLKDWEKLVETTRKVKKLVKIGVVGKYFKTGKFTLKDSYISLIEAIKHASWYHKRKPEIHWLEAGKYGYPSSLLGELKKYDGIVCPSDFGSKGVEGKIKAIEFCRKNKIPSLVVGLGMQLAVVEFARNVCGLREASSTEFVANCKYPVIDALPEGKTLLKGKKYGRIMRLGAHPCEIRPKTISFKAYRCSLISERHRHGYVLNNEFREILERKGMVIAGVHPKKDLVEIVELKNHPFFVGTQFHPEYKSRPLKPHPLFREFVKACIKGRNGIS